MLSSMTELQIAISEFSDYHKAVFNFRPSVADLPKTMEEVVQRTNALTDYFDKVASTPEGKQRLIDEGWVL